MSVTNQEQRTRESVEAEIKQLLAQVEAGGAETEVLLALGNNWVALAWLNDSPQDKNDFWLSCYERAERTFKTILETESENAVVLNNLAVTLMDRGQHADAEPFLLTAAKLLPEDRNVQFNYGVVILQRDRERGLQLMQGSTKLEPGAMTLEAYFDPHAS